MYPQRELIRLAARKAALQRRIAGHRADCLVAAAFVVQPLEWLDRALAFLRQASPLALVAAVPLGLLLKRASGPRLKLLGSVLKWAPLIFGVVRGVGTAVKHRFGSARA